MRDRSSQPPIEPFMKKHSNFRLLVALSFMSTLLVSCGGNSNKSSVKNSDDELTNPSGELKELGKLEIYDPANLEYSNVSIINLYSIVRENNNISLDALKICDKKACWTLFDENDSKQIKLNNKITQQFAEKKSYGLGKYIIKNTGFSAKSLHYVYKGESSVLDLESEIVFDKPEYRDIYINESSVLKVALSSVSVPLAKNILFLSDEALNHEFSGGLILEIPKGAIDQTAFLNAIELKSGKTKTTEVFPVKSYHVGFFNIKENKSNAKNMINSVPNISLKKIKVLLPIVSSTEIDQEKYSLVINGEIIEYQIVNKNDKRYAQFETNRTRFNALFVENHPGLELGL